MKYSSFKTEDPLPLEEGVLSRGPVDSPCIFESKFDVTTYREKTPRLGYGEKVDLVKNVFVLEKNFCFLEATRYFKYEWILLFPWLYYSLSEDASYYLSIFFCLVMIFLLKFLGFTAHQGLAKCCFVL